MTDIKYIKINYLVEIFTFLTGISPIRFEKKAENNTRVKHICNQT